MYDSMTHEIIHLLKSINNHLQAIRERLGPIPSHEGERVLTKAEKSIPPRDNIHRS
jgi:hypothetical protein